jgi:hypothetical protein
MEQVRAFFTLDFLFADYSLHSFISDCVREELQLFPTDRLALIVGDKSPTATAAATATATASSSTGGRLSGVLREGASARQPLTPTNVPNTNFPPLPSFGGMRACKLSPHLRSIVC